MIAALFESELGPRDQVLDRPRRPDLTGISAFLYICGADVDTDARDRARRLWRPAVKRSAAAWIRVAGVRCDSRIRDRSDAMRVAQRRCSRSHKIDCGPSGIVRRDFCVFGDWNFPSYTDSRIESVPISRWRRITWRWTRHASITALSLTTATGSSGSHVRRNAASRHLRCVGQVRAGAGPIREDLLTFR
jgi:hypothetical protein